MIFIIKIKINTVENGVILIYADANNQINISAIISF